MVNIEGDKAKRASKRTRLTQQGVDRLKPVAGKQTILYDEVVSGLILRLNGAGSKSWRILYYVDRKTCSHGLGSFPAIGVKQARELAVMFKANLPAFLAQPVEQPPKATFREVADLYFRREVEGRLRSARQIRSTLDNAIFPRWAERPFEEIRRRDVTKLLDEFADKGHPRAADMVLALVRRMANWYASRSDDYTSPVVKGMSRSKPAERRGTRILSDDEIRAFWLASSDLGTFGALAKMLLLTAQRRIKCSTMRFVDVIDGTWIIAAEKREKGNAERLRLPPVALAIIDAQAELRINDYIFPASRDGRRNGPGAHFGSFSAFGQGKGDLDRAMAKALGEAPPHWTLHDLRRTARSLMSRADVRPDIAERVLGHAIVGVEAVYDRHSYDEQRAAALVALANLIARIVTPPAGNVVPIKGRA